jgi:hypothetical protein
MTRNGIMPPHLKTDQYSQNFNTISDIEFSNTVMKVEAKTSGKIN